MKTHDRVPPSRQQAAGAAKAWMAARDVVAEYLRSPGSGDLERAAAIAADVRIDGAFGSVRTRAKYLAALRRGPPSPATVAIVERIDAGQRVAVIYDYLQHGTTLHIAQCLWLRDAHTVRKRPGFDRGEVAR